MLKNRKVIVTGAASGIGKEIVKQCLYEGASVIACDINEHSLYDLKQSMDDRYVLHTYQLDVSNHEEVVKFFVYVEAKQADVDGLVNNEGIYLAKNILDYQVDEIDKVLDINVKG
ncbi:SDR family oxidoreductase, partial [Peribacillus frigoritolerans]|uniref:SDR family NAD(P)-dependent oxidoreductase n=1 Tax=Peribacillus frigoritolerans TaxID=450367 RepID=UPI0032B3B6BB